MPGFSFFVTLTAGALAWTMQRLPKTVVAGGFGLALSFVMSGSILDWDPSWWINGVTFAAIVTGGVFLGRILPPRWTPMVALLGVLTVIDIIWIASGGAAGDATETFANFAVRIGNSTATIGTGDVLLAAAITSHWRSRGAHATLAIAAAPFGMILANLFFAVSRVRNLALVPFIAVGWIGTEMWWRRLAETVVPVSGERQPTEHPTEKDRRRSVR